MGGDNHKYLQRKQLAYTTEAQSKLTLVMTFQFNLIHTKDHLICARHWARCWDCENTKITETQSISRSSLTAYKSGVERYKNTFSKAMEGDFLPSEVWLTLGSTSMYLKW